MWRRAWESNGEMRTRRCTPFSLVSMAVGVAALDDEGDRVDAGLLRRGELVDLDGEAPALGPAAVHAQQHLGPVGGVGAAGPGVDLADGVALVVLAGEEGLQVDGGEVAVEAGQPAGDLLLQRLVALLAGQLVERLEVGQAALEPLDEVDVVLDAGQLGRHLPGRIGVVPQRRVAGLLFELDETGPGGVDAEIAAGVLQAAPQVGQVVREVPHGQVRLQRDDGGRGYEGKGREPVLQAASPTWPPPRRRRGTATSTSCGR